MDEVFTISANDVNEAPAAIALDNTAVDENPGGAVVGNLTVTDEDAGDSHPFTVSDARFEVVAGQLKLRAGESLDFETEPGVNLDVTATGLLTVNLIAAPEGGGGETPAAGTDAPAPASPPVLPPETPVLLVPEETADSGVASAEEEPFEAFDLIGIANSINQQSPFGSAATGGVFAQPGSIFAGFEVAPNLVAADAFAGTFSLNLVFVTAPGSTVTLSFAEPGALSAVADATGVARFSTNVLNVASTLQISVVSGGAVLRYEFNLANLIAVSDFGQGLTGYSMGDVIGRVLNPVGPRG